MKRTEMVELIELLCYREGINKTWNLTTHEFANELLDLVEETCYECSVGKIEWEEEWNL